ncbi:MAG: DUF5701 family protein [Actinomycetes bacterium]
MTLTRTAQTDALRQEFDRQVENLIHRGYPALAGLTEGALLGHLEPLRDRLTALDAVPADLDAPRLPLVLVIAGDVVPSSESITHTEMRGRPGFTTMEPDDLARFAPTSDVEAPAGPAYLLVDVDTGADTLDVVPDDALGTITRVNRSPLTVEEGIAVVTHHPEVLRTHNCFSLLGSRCGDRRVPALWVSKGRPRLGWCWAGAPHTWLGSASAGGRVGV